MRAVEIRGLHYTYPDGTVALRGVNLEVEEGESVYLMGPNGSGKSTLLLHLNGLLLPQRGEVRVFGRDTREGVEEIRRRVGLVFQDPDDQLFMPTVFEDVAFGPLHLGLGEREVRRRVREALRAVGAEGLGRRSPHHLSYGEKKRVAIATILSMEPQLLVLDEPTLGLDPWARREFLSLLERLKRGRTLVMAGHDLELMELCDRALLLRRGRVEREVDPEAWGK
ncbi:MAG: cobalt ABC transporter ATP-binding protein [Hadesarchaea archaeon]|nr:MAG: cobalt ABC transporter ATP-binding protein [Hadesarchaea archaeon]